ncbi:ATP-binding protein [Metabacillus fastidiosus]|uniref:sensor histidine kinase n=1 Tax=Metabacillus fastidiosus TaxID=1458 RepID=UPI002E214F5E|nr:GHKL domain-containing protein [Metabacillus fastidiosus]
MLALIRSTLQIVIESTVFFLTEILNFKLYNLNLRLWIAGFTFFIVGGLFALLHKYYQGYEKFKNIDKLFKNKYVFYISILTLFLIILNTLHLFDPDLLSASNKTFELFTTVFTFFYIIFIFLFIIKILKQYEYENLKNTEEAYSKSFQDLLYSIRSQKHDYFNHIHVLHRLIKNNNYNEAVEYIDIICSDIIYTQELIKINNLPVSALLNAKFEIAKTKRIPLDLNINHELPTSLKMKSHELVRILGNLIDNAIEEEMRDNKFDKKITVKIDRFMNAYLVISVWNKNSFISTDMMRKICKEGVTTKENSKNKGMGLFIVSKILNNYNGHLDIESNLEKGTTFSVFIPY